jgi:hypothetical protein
MLRQNMKKQFVILTAGILAITSGCSTPTALRVAVGPDPSIVKNVDTDGTLRVFSATEEENDVGFETPYDQRTDYYIYAANGKEIRRVLNNNKGHFEDRPRGIRLPPGTYRIKALAAVGLGEWVIVPVVIEPGRTTGVHLNGHWRPPANTPKDELVPSPAGFPMGWRAVPAPNS